MLTRTVTVIVAVAIATICQACERKAEVHVPRFQIVTASNGHIYRLNTDSGEILRIRGSLVDSQDVVSRAGRSLDPDFTATREVFNGPLTFLKTCTGRILLTWEEGTVHVTVIVKPYPPLPTGKTAKDCQLDIDLTSIAIGKGTGTGDNARTVVDSFSQQSFLAPLSSVSPIVNDAGEVVEGRYRTTFEATSDEYERIHTATIHWRE